jgi:dihydrofolate reductase
MLDNTIIRGQATSMLILSNRSHSHLPSNLLSNSSRFNNSLSWAQVIIGRKTWQELKLCWPMKKVLTKIWLTLANLKTISRAKTLKMISKWRKTVILNTTMTLNKKRSSVMTMTSMGSKMMEWMIRNTMRGMAMDLMTSIITFKLRINFREEAAVDPRNIMIQWLLEVLISRIGLDSLNNLFFKQRLRHKIKRVALKKMEFFKF